MPRRWGIGQVKRNQKSIAQNKKKPLSGLSGRERRLARERTVTADIGHSRPGFERRVGGGPVNIVLRKMSRYDPVRGMERKPRPRTN